MEKYIIRETIIKIMREFFYNQNFHEVIIPVLNTALPLEPNLRPFITTHTYKNTKETFYLSMSPERGIKKMLAEGMGNCFAISPSFRNYERVGPLHFHEFIMLEWYRKKAVYTDIMDDTEVLLRMVNKKMKNKMMMKHTHFPRISLNDLFEEKIGEKLVTLINDEQLLRKLAEKKGYNTEGQTTWEELYDQLFVNEIEQTFSSEPFFLIDFPARTSPLSKKQKKNPLLAERFELYIYGVEIANGNTENTDTKSIRSEFEKEHKKTGMPIDEEFLASLELMKNDSYAGVGLGIDRLAMVYDKSDIIKNITVPNK